MAKCNHDYRQAGIIIRDGKTTIVYVCIYCEDRYES